MPEPKKDRKREGQGRRPGSVTQPAQDDVRILLEAIVNSSSDAIVGKTRDGIITSWNPAAERIFGYTEREAIGQSTRMLFPSDLLDEELEILARIGRGEQVRSFDTVRVRKDRSLVQVSVTVSPIRDGRGTIVGASKIARDITERNLAEAQLRQSEDRFRSLVDSIPQLAWTARPDGFIFWYNQRWYEFTGTTPAQMEGWGWQAVHDPRLLGKVMTQWKAAIGAGEAFEMEFPLRGADGVFRRFLTRAVPVKNAAGQVLQWTGTNTDVDELKRVEADLKSTATENALIADALYIEKERAQVTLNSIGDAVICTDIDGRVSFLNAAAATLTQWASAEATGRPVDEVFRVIEAESRAALPNPMGLAAEQNIVMALPASCILLCRDGTERYIEDSCAPIHDRTGRVTGAVMVFHDVSSARQLSQQLAYQAAHDSLTDLPNRSLFRDRLGQAVAAVHRHSTSLALLYLDIDRFKHTNDSLGHAIGDRLLQSVASRLTERVRASDTVSRQGGDEFVILLVDIEGPRDAQWCAEKLLQALRRPHLLDATELHVSASIGIALCPQDRSDVEMLLSNADSAMYEAKRQGRDNYQFYRRDLNESAVARLALERDLRYAIERQQLELYYQPIMDLGSGALAGVEALLRWHHPVRGLLVPADFMAIAEESGLIVPIGQWVLRSACLQAQQWQLAGMAPLRYAVNVSAVELRASGYAAGVAAVIRDTALEPSVLELELTETFLMQDSRSTALVLRSLKDLHVNLALDDFGTGYSSLSYMRRFPIDTLKIDRSFVKDLTTDAADASVVSAVINMGRSLHMLVVAEGVETREQLSFLEAQGCQQAQGHFFSEPVPAARFSGWRRPMAQ